MMPFIQIKLIEEEQENENRPDFKLLIGRDDQM